MTTSVAFGDRIRPRTRWTARADRLDGPFPPSTIRCSTSIL